MKPETLSLIGYTIGRVLAVVVAYYALKYGFHYTMNPFELYVLFLIQGLGVK